jgi:hypothetical protein
MKLYLHPQTAVFFVLLQQQTEDLGPGPNNSANVTSSFTLSMPVTRFAENYSRIKYPSDKHTRPETQCRKYHQIHLVTLAENASTLGMVLNRAAKFRKKSHLN